MQNYFMSFWNAFLWYYTPTAAGRLCVKVRKPGGMERSSRFIGFLSRKQIDVTPGAKLSLAD